MLAGKAVLAQLFIIQKSQHPPECIFRIQTVCVVEQTGDLSSSMILLDNKFFYIFTSMMQEHKYLEMTSTFNIGIYDKISSSSFAMIKPVFL